MQEIFFYSQQEMRNWFQLLLSILFLCWITNMISALSGPWTQPPLYRSIMITICFLVIAGYALSRSAVFEEIAKCQVKKARRFSEDELKKYSHQIQALVEEERLFLDPNLRLLNLADKMRLKPSEVSEVLNRGLRTSFYEWIGSFRVEEAKRRLLDPKYQHLNILGIALDCGFNSKSSFAEIFRKKTHQTPSEYRKQNKLLNQA